jgi:hypothetical protein
LTGPGRGRAKAGGPFMQPALNAPRQADISNIPSKADPEGKAGFVLFLDPTKYPVPLHFHNLWAWVRCEDCRRSKRPVLGAQGG